MRYQLRNKSPKPFIFCASTCNIATLHNGWLVTNECCVSALGCAIAILRLRILAGDQLRPARQPKWPSREGSKAISWYTRVQSAAARKGRLRVCGALCFIFCPGGGGPGRLMNRVLFGCFPALQLFPIHNSER